MKILGFIFAGSWTITTWRNSQRPFLVWGISRSCEYIASVFLSLSENFRIYIYFSQWTQFCDAARLIKTFFILTYMYVHVCTSLCAWELFFLDSTEQFWGTFIRVRMRIKLMVIYRVWRKIYLFYDWICLYARSPSLIRFSMLKSQRSRYLSLIKKFQT